MDRYAWQLLLLIALLGLIGLGKNLARASSSDKLGLASTKAVVTSGSGSGGILGLGAAQSACLQNPGGNDWLTFDTGSGAYTFTGCNPGEFTLSGTGTVRTVNGVAVLMDTKPDRRVVAYFFLNQGTGHATVTQILAGGVFHTLSINSPAGQPCVCHP
jgi:hypothetical protein